MKRVLSVAQRRCPLSFYSREVSPEPFTESASRKDATVAALPWEDLGAHQEPAEGWSLCKVWARNGVLE